MMKNKHLVIDTNILLYLSNQVPDATDKTLQKTSQLKDDGYVFFITEQVIREFLVAKTNLQRIEKAIDYSILKKDIEYLYKNFLVLHSSETSLSVLIKYILQYQLLGKKIHDANIAAVASANNINIIFTNNISDFTFAINEGFEIITL